MQHSLVFVVSSSLIRQMYKDIHMLDCDRDRSKDTDQTGFKASRSHNLYYRSRDMSHFLPICKATRDNKLSFYLSYVLNTVYNYEHNRQAPKSTLSRLNQVLLRYTTRNPLSPVSLLTRLKTDSAFESNVAITIDIMLIYLTAFS